MTRRGAYAVAIAVLLAVGACSGGDNADRATTTSASRRSTTTTDSGTSSTTTQPTGTEVEAVTPVLQALIGRYDAAVAAILADPRVASNPADPKVVAYLELFTENSSFADGALGNWVREGDAGRFYRPGPRGQLTSSNVMEVTPANDDEAAFRICAQNSMEITDAEGNVIESFGGQTAASVVAVRIDGIWRIRDLTEAPTSGCPERGAGQ